MKKIKYDYKYFGGSSLMRFSKNEEEQPLFSGEIVQKYIKNEGWAPVRDLGCNFESMPKKEISEERAFEWLVENNFCKKEDVNKVVSFRWLLENEHCKKEDVENFTETLGWLIECGYFKKQDFKKIVSFINDKEECLEM